MERFTHRYHDGQAWVSLNLVSKMMENECVGLPITKLAEYEDLEESGRLVKLPCAVGDTVWVITKSREIEESKVRDVSWRGITYPEGQRFWLNIGALIYFEQDFGKTVFLTHEAAETKLKEVKDE